MTDLPTRPPDGSALTSSTTSPPGGPSIIRDELVVLPREAREHQGRTAGIVTRAIAAVIDAVTVAAVLVAAWAGWVGVRFLAAPRHFSVPAVEPLLGSAAGTLTAVAYLTVTWAGSGRSHGKRVMGLRVVGSRGGRLSPVVALARACLCVLVPLGLCWCAVSARGRSLADVVLRTRVVHDWGAVDREPPT